MRVVDVSRDQKTGQLWATIGGSVPVDLPIEDVPKAALLRFLASQRGVVALGGLALGGLVDELQAAGRSKVEQWAQQLNNVALKWLRFAEQYEAMMAAAGSARAPGHVIDRLREAMQAALTRRSRIVTVRDWLYATAGELTDVDDFDRTNQRGVSGLALGAVQVPIAVTAIVAGAGLAAWIAREVRVAAEHARLVEQRGQMVQGYATARTDQERKAFATGLSQVGQDLERRDDGFPWGKLLGFVALALGGGAVVKKVMGR